MFVYTWANSSARADGCTDTGTGEVTTRTVRAEPQLITQYPAIQVEQLDMKRRKKSITSGGSAHLPNGEYEGQQKKVPEQWSPVASRVRPTQGWTTKSNTDNITAATVAVTKLAAHSSKSHLPKPISRTHSKFFLSENCNLYHHLLLLPTVYHPAVVFTPVRQINHVSFHSVLLWEYCPIPPRTWL